MKNLYPIKVSEEETITLKEHKALQKEMQRRKIIGYAYGTTMTADLAVQAVKNACLNVKDTRGIILHNDLGRQ